jgi:hypothetical protein
VNTYDGSSHISKDHESGRIVKCGFERTRW